METAAVKASEAAETALREAPCHAAAIETAERTLVAGGAWRGEPMAVAEKSTWTTKSAAAVVDAIGASTIRVIVAVNERRAVGDVPVVVENDRVVVPVGCPVVPAPGKPTEETNSEAHAKRDPRRSPVQARVPIPTWPGY
jgi:hypothetical protein